jgi:hypothetical protein
MSKYSNEFNINSLFGTNISNTITSNTLDINNLFNQDGVIYNFDTTALKKIIADEQDYLIRVFNNEYKKCCMTILNAGNHKTTQTVYTVIDEIPDNSLYKPDECLLFIQAQLHEKNIASTIIPPLNLLIDWSHYKTDLIFKK